MNPWRLPTSLTIGGVGYAIKTDYRDVLTALSLFQNPDLEEDEKWLACLMSLFEDGFSIPPAQWPEAQKAVSEFVDVGITSDSKSPSSMDWEQDAPIIIPAVNSVAGVDVRSVKYIHWWTFLGYYMEINDKSLFSYVLHIRQKLMRKEKLEKEEKRFKRENKHLIELKPRLSKAEQEYKEKMEKIFGIRR